MIPKLLDYMNEFRAILYLIKRKNTVYFPLIKNYKINDNNKGLFDIESKVSKIVLFENISNFFMNL